MISLLKMAPKAEMPSSVPKYKAMLFYREIHVLDNILSGMSYGAAGCEFSVNASTIHK